MSEDSPQDQAFWTAERVERLEQALAKWQHQDTVYAKAFLDRLQQRRSLEDKRSLILEDLLPAIASSDMIKLWEGREIVTRLALRDLVDDFLYREGVIENLPPADEILGDDTEREHLSRLFGEGKPVSDIVMEERGPR